MLRIYDPQVIIIRGTAVSYGIGVKSCAFFDNEVESVQAEASSGC